ncbi:hypothetical protein [Bartonella sp. HY038]|uniref:hypothetical protein n=1 Tax=Bartonella sp. HY038 TaxID=2759660 RepID=UPI0015FE142C|nr:hypothetical protein [Bartonella sp. HY038]
MVKFSKAFSIILFIAAISLSNFLASSSFGAEALSKDRCQSSMLLDGMKVELSLTSPIIVDKKTHKLVENDFNDEEKRQVIPSIRLSFTATDKDIKWQKALYTSNIWYGYMLGDSWTGLSGHYTPPIITEKLLEISLLKKGKKEIILYPLSHINFKEYSAKNGFDMTFAAMGRLMDINVLTPRDRLTNPYYGDKNIWQAPFEICLKAKWQYN